MSKNRIETKFFTLIFAALLAIGRFSSAFCADANKSDVEIWNEGVELYRKGDVTNALSKLKPLTLSKDYASRAAEVVAKIEFETGDRENAALSAQIALRSNPKDDRVNRNFTRAVDGLLELKESKRVEQVLKSSEGKDPSYLLESAMRKMREIMVSSATYTTNAPQKRVEMADRLSSEASKAADTWIVARRFLQNAVTNEEQAATIQMQVDEAEKHTLEAARRLGDIEEGAFESASQSEHDFTRFFKLVAMPPSAIAEDLVAQSNAWLDVEVFNDRQWQSEALDYTRAFRAKFPAWAKAYEEQALADTNKPPFTAEAQAQISSLATELEKIQIECVSKNLPPKQEEAIDIIIKIRDLLPKDGGGSGSNNQQGQNNDNKDKNSGEKNKNGDDDKAPKQNDEKNDDLGDQKQEEENQEDKEEEEEKSSEEKEESKDEKEIEALLKKAQERNDEHEAEKKARMRKAPLPPNERDW
jgi:hypothetical protein